MIDELSNASLAQAPGPVPGLAPRVHLLGAGGAGVSAIGLLLEARGHHVRAQATGYRVINNTGDIALIAQLV